MTKAQQKTRKKRRWILLAALILILGGAVFGLRAAFKPNHTIDASKIGAVERGDLARSVVATGKIEPRAKAQVKSKASGIVKKILVDYGDRVKSGQILVELDKEELQAQVREAKATLLAARAAEDSAKAAHERNQAEAEGPDLPFLKTAMDRARTLFQQGRKPKIP